MVNENTIKFKIKYNIVLSLLEMAERKWKKKKRFVFIRVSDSCFS